MGGKFQKLLLKSRKFVSVILIFTILFTDIGVGLFQNTIPVAEASQVTIDSDASALGTSHEQTGSQTVFVDDQVGYKFFRDAPGYCVYRKTLNGGVSWSATTSVDAQTDCIEIQVWYDKWTPGLPTASSSIHIVTLDTGNDDLWYNRLNTTDDSLLLASTSVVSMLTGSGQGGTSITEGENHTSITRGSDGTLYAVSNDGTANKDSFIVECTVACQTNTNWTETGINPLSTASSDKNILMPLTSGNILLINNDIANEDMRSKVWNNAGSAWSAGWTTFDANASDNTSYDQGLSAVVSSTTPGTVYVAYLAHVATLGSDDQVRTAIYSGTTWATSTDVLTSTTRGLTGVAIGIDTANDDVYVGYTGQTTAGTANTGNVYWKSATSSMKNWSTEVGPINSSADDMYGLDINIASDQRIFASWFDNTDDDIFGDTIADIFPGVHASTTGSQITTAYASTSALYLGGSFMIYDNYNNHDVTGITITESGTIDGLVDIDNVKLRYDLDATYPYNCADQSYAVGDTQFGTTDLDGFSAADGTSAFSGSTVNVSSTSVMCVYVEADIRDSTANNATIDISIANPATDVAVTGWTIQSTASWNISGATTVLNDIPTQAHFHFRKDDGTELTATSKTGGTEDTSLGALQQNAPIRLRFEISNEGGSSTPNMQYRIEYASTSGACSVASTWVDVGGAGGDFDMYDSPNFLDGGNTTNIANGIGGMTDENSNFLISNAGMKDLSSQTADILLTSTDYVDLEYSIMASSSAPSGNRYCFRLTNAGQSLYAYTVYPTVVINPDVIVGITSSSQITATSVPSTNFYVGSSLSIKENFSSRNVTSITIAESGTVDAQTNLDNIRLKYDLDTTAPYDCESETYSGSESPFGSTDTDGFSAINGSSTFTGSSVLISTTQSMCVYVVLDVTDTAVNSQTLNIVMTQPSIDVLVTDGGVVGGVATLDMNGVTTLNGPVLTQTHYHWRRDNGSEISATSATGGVEDVGVANVSLPTPLRLRMQISNEGPATSSLRNFQLEYGSKITSCSDVISWTDVGAIGGDFDMYNSPSVTDGSDTTNISTSLGGVSDENTTFKSPNSALKDTFSSIDALTLTPLQFLETEFSIKQTAGTPYNQTYCFRLSESGTALHTYSIYPELTTSAERDFEIQRGTVTISGTSATLTGGVDYVIPNASTSAYIRITNTSMTGAGSTSGGAQNADSVTAYILNPSNIMSSVTIARPATASGDTKVSWELIEFTGEAGSDNEIIVRSQTAVTYGVSNTSVTGPTVPGVSTDADVVVFITGQLNPDTTQTIYNVGLSTSAWLSSSNQPEFTRGESGNTASVVSYAVVEFTGSNWSVQRSEHTFSSAGVTETESISAVNSLSRTFIHTQKRSGTGLSGTDEFGAEVWLSSIGFVSYALESGATTPSDQSSVAWVIENMQTSFGSMDVTRSNGNSIGGTPPLTLSISIGKTLSDLTNASLFVNTRSSLSTYPDPIVSATLASTTHYELWRSTTASTITYRTEVVEWPTAGLAVKQNYYRFYVDNNAIDPTDPWPSGGVDLGENTVITSFDEPVNRGEQLRLRMSFTAVNASLPASARTLRLQYGAMVTTCSGIQDSDWHTLGAVGSSTLWRGFNATGVTDGTALSGDPPTGGDLNLTVSDVSGSIEEENDSSTNPFAVPEGNDMEYDWIIENNSASAHTYYCFRAIESDGTVLNAYLQYPQLITANFAPRTQNWRWYNGASAETPTTTLAAENVAPNNIANGQNLTLRIAVKEIKDISQNDTRFKLQYSESSNFSVVFNVATSTTCTATSTWCYVDGAGVDNTKITTATLSDADSCVASIGNGCGTHTESPSILTGYEHINSATAEYSFTLKSAGPRVNRVYYFRLYDLVQDTAVPINTGESYPSLATEGASLIFSMEGISSGSTIEGITTDITTTPRTVPFGVVPVSTFVEGVHRLTIDTNGTQGHQILMMMTSDLLSASGAKIKPITGTNEVPTAWATGCDVSATSCFGYHTGDDTLQGGSTRFSAIDTYARMSTTTPEEVSYNSQPVVGEVTDIVFRLFRRQLQDAGQYESSIMYISVPMF